MAVGEHWTWTLPFQPVPCAPTVWIVPAEPGRVIEVPEGVELLVDWRRKRHPDPLAGVDWP